MGSRRSAPSLFALSGWLFADLLLVLSVIVLGGTTVVAPASAATSTATVGPTVAAAPTAPTARPTGGRTPMPVASATARALPARTPTATSCAPALDPRAVTLNIGVDVPGLLAGQPAAQTSLQRTFRAAFDQGLATRHLGETYDAVHAGLVETFGTSPPSNRPFGMLIAEKVNAALMGEPPLRRAVVNNFIQSDTPANQVQMRLYLYGRACA